MATPVVRVVPVQEQVGVGVPEMEAVEPALEVPGAAAQEVEVAAQRRADKAAIRSATTRATGCSRAVGANSGRLYEFDRPGWGGRLGALVRRTGGHVRTPRRPPRVFAALILPLLVPLASSAPTASETETGPHFPKPPALHARVEFWNRIITVFGVGDFVLHDRENLGVIYDDPGGRRGETGV